VIETGGLLSHGASISREYGIPAVQLPGAIQIVDVETLSGTDPQATLERGLPTGDRVSE